MPTLPMDTNSEPTNEHEPTHSHHDRADNCGHLRPCGCLCLANDSLADGAHRWVGHFPLGDGIQAVAIQAVSGPTPIPPPSAPPLRRVEDRDLPPYRFVPGLNPHPFRHPDGHMFTDGSSPGENERDETTDWRHDTQYLYAADLFDHRYFWEAHEQWEVLWRFASPGGDTRAALQSLIQIAAAMLQHHMGSAKSARTLLGRAEARISPALLTERTVFQGIDLGRLIADCRACIEGGPWPLLHMETP